MVFRSASVLPMPPGIDDTADADIDMPSMVADELPEAAPPIADDLEQALLGYVLKGHRRAEGLVEPWHRKWEKYRRLMAGEWDEDDPENVLSEEEVYLPKLAEFIDFSCASELMQLIPDATAMDFVSVLCNWAGLEESCERSEALLRQKLRIMQPRDSNGFYQSVLRLMRDRRGLGNMLGIVTHETFDGDSDGDNRMEGPSVDRIDPLNWFPWSITVDNAKECAHTIYSPISDEQLDELPYIDSNRLRERITLKPTRRTNPTGDSTLVEDDLGPDDELYERFIYFGPLPWRAVGRTLDRPEMTREMLIEQLAGLYDFDPANATKSKWWVIEWIGDVICCARPFEIALPYGRGPIFHEPYHHINGQLIGRSIYDRNSWDERLYNAYHRFMLRLGGLAARPPMLARKWLLDDDWLAEHDDQPSLDPDELIMLKNISGQEKIPPFEPLLLNVQAMPVLQGEAARLENNMRGGTGVSSDYQGMSRAKTATQSENNLSQSQMLEQHEVRTAEQGWLKDIILRVYVVMQQVIQMTGEPQYARGGYDDEFVKTYAVLPENVQSLTYFDIELSGSSAPGNKLFMIQQLQQFAATMMPTGEFDVREIGRVWLQMMGIRGKNLFMRWDTTDPQEMMANLASAMGGAGGVGALSPKAQMMLAQMMGPELARQMTMGAGAEIQQAGQQGGMPAPGGGGVGQPRLSAPHAPQFPGMTNPAMMQ